MIRIEGKFAVVEEIAPKFFPHVIRWRNDKNLNRYLNQPYELTPDLEKRWYEEIYLRDETQGLLVILDKETGTPLGTKGWTNFDAEKRRCISGRLLFGDKNFARHPAFTEGILLAYDFTFVRVDIQFSHVVNENLKSAEHIKKFGFVENTGEIQYPAEILVNGMVQREYFCTREMYLAARKKFERFFDRR